MGRERRRFARHSAGSRIRLAVRLRPDRSGRRGAHRKLHELRDSMLLSQGAHLPLRISPQLLKLSAALRVLRLRDVAYESGPPRTEGIDQSTQLGRPRRSVERHLDALLATGGRIRNLKLRGAGDAIDVEATVIWKGVPARVRLELAEIRLRHRHFGFRMRRLRALGAVRVPRAAVAVALRAAGSRLLTVFPAPGIVVVDLRRWLPASWRPMPVASRSALMASIFCLTVPCRKWVDSCTVFS